MQGSIAIVSVLVVTVIVAVAALAIMTKLGIDHGKGKLIDHGIDKRMEKAEVEIKELKAG